MGMPVVVEIVGATHAALDPIFEHFRRVDAQFSPFKLSSEVSRINRREIAPDAYSALMREILALAEETRLAARGYFNIQNPDGILDPSGLVKGWAIRHAARLARETGHIDYWIEAGGDIQVAGKNAEGDPWRVGIRHPFDEREIVKVLRLSDCGVATSGNYVRGDHIYNPHTGKPAPSGLVSTTVVASDVYEADRFATAAFAMGAEGIAFIESLPGCEGYAIAEDGTATMTSGFAAHAAEKN